MYVSASPFMICCTSKKKPEANISAFHACSYLLPRKCVCVFDTFCFLFDCMTWYWQFKYLHSRYIPCLVSQFKRRRKAPHECKSVPCFNENLLLLLLLLLFSRFFLSFVCSESLFLLCACSIYCNPSMSQ